MLVYVRSLRQASFTMYLDALTELAPWFHALDRTNYARWIPVHMAELPTKHPDVARKFRTGSFRVQKTKKVFSMIAIDQAHEQNNACIKEDGGAVGLTDNPSALLRWMVAGPEEFQDRDEHWGRRGDTRHYDQTPSVQTSFAKNVRSLVSVIEELGNPLEEECMDLAVLDTKEMACPVAVERTKPIYVAIRRNKLKVFSTSTPRSVSQGKQQVSSLKKDLQLFSRLYIGCHVRGGHLQELFCHENQAYPPAVSDGGNLRLGTKTSPMPPPV